MFLITLGFLLAQGTLPGPVYVLIGVIITTIGAIVQAKISEKNEAKKAKVEAEAPMQEVVFKAGEQIRHELRDELERARHEIVDLRRQVTESERRRVEEGNVWRRKVEELEDELFDISERLRREEAKNGSKPDTAE